LGEQAVHFNEVKDMLIQVITTWQVIAVTVVVILYLFLVFYVARLRGRARLPHVSHKRARKAAAAPVVAMADEDMPESEGFEEEVITEE
jgi:heme/copper-type cytochrome/quinol oxidase subunit 2